MRTVFLSISFLILFLQTTLAEDHLFKVFYVKGNVTVLQKSQTTTLIKDHLIFSGDKITLENKNTLVLLNTDNKPLVIEDAGTYNTKK